MKVIIHVENRDPLIPGKVSRPLDVEDAIDAMRDVVFRVATGEYSAAYVVRENPLKM